jgi:lipopolysaccharide heptosyltransferase II
MDGIGDLAMTSAIFPSIRKRYPTAQIDLLTSNVAERVAQLLVDEGWIDSIRVLPLLRRSLRQYVALARSFTAEKYDAGIDLRGDMRNVLLMWFAGIPIRAGLVESGFSYLLSEKLELPEGSHQALESTELVRRIGVTDFDPWPRLPLRDADLNAADQWLRENNVAVDRPICAMHLSAFLPVKVWPLDRFVAVAKRLRDQLDVQFVVIGGGGETEIAADFARQVDSRVAIAAGKTDIVTTAAILSRCSLFIGNDSGPAHLAACVGCPVIDLFGPADPRRYRPLSPDTIVMVPHTACDPRCDKVCAREATRCMLDHTVDTVFAAAEKLIRERLPTRHSH